MKKVYFNPPEGVPKYAVVVFGNQEGSASFPLPWVKPWEPDDAARCDGYYLVYGTPSKHWREATIAEVNGLSSHRLYRDACDDFYESIGVSGA